MSKIEKAVVKRSQQRITAELDRLKAMLDSMDDGIYIVGRDYRIRFMNRALRNEMGDGEGLYCHEFFGHGQPTCNECQHSMSSFGPEIRREWTFPGSQKVYEALVSPMHEPNGEVSRIHILRDITVRKNLEGKLQEYSETLEAKVAEQSEKLLRQERLSLLGEISAGLAHEVRTPLGAILTGIKLLEKTCPSDEEQKSLFDILKREVMRLERKLSEFLSYARVRSPRPVEANIPSLLDELRALISTDRELAGDVEIRTVVDPRLTVWLLDYDQMKESLLNICINALQSLAGKGALTLEARLLMNAVEILVRDNGPGIPSDELPHIFKPFYTKRSGGSGLGLAISKQIIESQGGRIDVTSIPGLNTTFRIFLPCPSAPTSKKSIAIG